MRIRSSSSQASAWDFGWPHEAIPVHFRPTGAKETSLSTSEPAVPLQARTSFLGPHLGKEILGGDTRVDVDPEVQTFLLFLGRTGQGSEVMKQVARRGLRQPFGSHLV